MTPEQREKFREKGYLTREKLNDLEGDGNRLYWRDKDSLGRLNPRARKRVRMTDAEYLNKIETRDNMPYLYSQGFDSKSDGNDE